MVQLNDELQRAVHAQANGPVPVLDPSSNRVYVLISRDQYDRLRPLFENAPLTLDEQGQLLINACRRAGWDDPEMDAYDRYDEHRPSTP